MAGDEQADQVEQFRKEAQAQEAGLLREFWAFLKANKKWWLTPIILALLIVGGLILLGGTALAPFIYPLF